MAEPDNEVDPKARKYGQKRQAELAAPKGYSPPSGISQPETGGPGNFLDRLNPQQLALLAQDAQRRAVAMVRANELAASGVPTLQQTLAQPMTQQPRPMAGLPGKQGRMVGQMATGASKPRKMSEGGEVPAHKVLREHDDHFVVDDGSGTPFRVAKDGLGEALIGRIRGYSDGGEVKAPPEQDDLAARIAKLEAASQEAQLPDINAIEREVRGAKGYAGGGEVGGWTPAPMEQPYDPWTQIRPGSPADGLMQSLQMGTQPGSPAAAMMGGLGYQVPDAPLPSIPSLPTGPAPMVSGMPGEMTAVEASPQPIQPTKPQAAPQGGGMGAPRGPDELQAGINQVGQADRAQADLAAIKSGEETAVWNAYLAETQQREARLSRKLIERQAVADAKHDAILASKIDPNRMWANASVGQQIGSVLGMVLGGLGASATGGRNLAVEQLNKTIDRDIEAQKVDLGTKQTDLEMYLREGRDMLQAEQLAKADRLDQASAQLKLTAAKFGGQEAAIAADMHAGQLRIQAQELRRAALTQEMQLRIAGAGLKAQQQAAMAAQQQAALMTSVLTAPRTASGGVSMPAGATEVLPKDMRERRVMLPDGSTGFAKDPAEAKTISDGLQGVAEAKRQLQRYRDLLSSGHPTISPADRANAKSLRASIMIALKDAAKLGALNESDMGMLEDQIPDIREATTLDSTLSSGLDAFGRSLDDKVMVKLRALGGMN